MTYHFNDRMPSWVCNDVILPLAQCAIYFYTPRVFCRRNGSAWVLPLLLHGDGTEYGYCCLLYTSDAVTAFETVYFCPDLPQCFREVYRVLKPGGTLLICNEANGDTAVSYTHLDVYKRQGDAFLFSAARSKLSITGKSSAKTSAFESLYAASFSF